MSPAVGAQSADPPIRVLLAKPGLDGHDVGAKLVGRALMEAGMEVVYTGLRKSPESIARMARNVDVVGLSILSGAHESLCRKVGAALQEENLTDLLWIVGGVIPVPDHASLREIGVDAVFPVGTPFEEIVDFIQENVRS